MFSLSFLTPFVLRFLAIAGMVAAVLAWGWWTKSLIADNAVLERVATENAAQADSWREALEAEKVVRARVERTLADRDAKQADISRANAKLRAEIRRLSRETPEVAEYLRTPVPDVLLDRLRQHSGGKSSPAD